MAFSLVRYYYTRLFEKKDVNILILGLDNAGKSSILNDIRRHFSTFAVEPTQPTIGQNFYKGVSGNFSVTCWDLGGQIKIRSVWEQYFDVVDCIFYVIDAAAPERLKESISVLKKIINNDLEEELKNVPILICMNKQDESKINLKKFGENMISNGIKLPQDLIEKPYVGDRNSDNGTNDDLEIIIYEMNEKSDNCRVVSIIETLTSNGVEGSERTGTGAACLLQWVQKVFTTNSSAMKRHKLRIQNSK